MLFTYRFNSRILANCSWPRGAPPYGDGFNNKGSNGNYWSSTANNANNAYNLNFNSSNVNPANNNNKYNGNSVRCVSRQ